jgi:hypothetical protein
MSNLPHIVRQRLGVPRVGDAGADHPDADLLTAFAERQLAAPERERVLAHLGTCAACREIVALASVEETPAQTVITPAGNRSWWSVRSYQYGALAAALVMAVVGLVLLNPNRAAQSAKVEQARAVPAVTSPAAEESRTATSPSVDKSQSLAEAKKPPNPDAAFGSRSKEAANGRTVIVEKPTAVAPKDLDNLAVVSNNAYSLKPEAKDADAIGAGVAARESSEFSSNVATRTARAPAAAPSGQAASGPVAGSVVTGQAAGQTGGARGTFFKVQRSDQLTKAAPTSQTPTAPTSANETVAVAAQAGAEPAPVNPPAQVAIDPSDAAKARRRKAETIAATNDTAAEQQAMLADSRYNTVAANWRIRNGRLQKLDPARDAYDDVTVSGTARLSVVGSLGNEVWVGGTDGTLRYSNDQGAHWIAVTTGAWSKDATFTALTPTALRSVEVYLSNGERWRSADGGASWSKYQ